MYYSSNKYSGLETSIFNAPIYQPSIDYSPIEQMANSYQLQHMNELKPDYSPLIKEKNYDNINLTENYNLNQPRITYTHIASNGFLNPDRPRTRFIGKADEIKHYIEEAFEKTTGKKFPKHITITVLKKEDLKKLHEKNNGIWSEGIMGFAIHKNFPEIFVRENELDQLMLTIGHELGHVFTKRLINSYDEEAKAFAFEIAWLKVLIKENIGGLKHSFNLNMKPAKNGLHDLAFNQVKKWLQSGKSAIKIYWELVKGVINVKKLTVLDYQIF